MKYKLFCSDFDGTLVRGDGTISACTKAAIARYMQAGGIFTVCTGRMITSILPRMEELGIHSGLVAAYQGGMIVDIATGKILRSETLNRADALRILRFLEEKDYHLHMYTDEGLYANRRDEMLEVYENICGVTAEISKEPLSERLENHAYSVYKLLVMLEPEVRDALFSELIGFVGENCLVTTSHPYLVEVTPRSANKGSAVRFLSEYFHVPYEAVAAIGDERNDLSLVEAAGGKFTVENAAEELKKIAHVMPSCEEDGVARALEIAMQS